MFDGITSPAQLWRQSVPESDALLEPRMKRSKLELPVLRTVTRHGGLSKRMLDSTLRYYFQRIVPNAGYYGTLTIHACGAPSRRSPLNTPTSYLHLVSPTFQDFPPFQIPTDAQSVPNLVYESACPSRSLADLFLSPFDTMLHTTH